jgi:uncharacterized membrane protein
MPRVHPVIRWPVQFLFSLLAVVIAAYAFAYLYLPHDARNPFAAQFALSGWWVPMHFFAAGLALALSPLQLSGFVRRRLPKVHRAAGWLYVGAIVVAAPSGFVLALTAQGNPVTGLSFGLLVVLWPIATFRGVLLAVTGDTARHRRWMCRSVAMTYTAVTLRVGLVVGVGMLHLSFMPVYIAMACGSWLLNLALCELILRWPARRRVRAGGGSRWVSGPSRA